jgi:hypothetical protein
MDAIMGRMIERILVAIAGVLCMFWGYRLFRIANERQGKMEMTHGDKLKLTMSDVAPGIWFALFGTALLVVSLVRGIAYSSTTVSGNSTQMTGMGIKDADTGNTVTYSDTSAIPPSPGIKSDNGMLDTGGRTLSTHTDYNGVSNRAMKVDTFVGSENPDKPLKKDKAEFTSHRHQ